MSGRLGHPSLVAGGLNLVDPESVIHTSPVIHLLRFVIDEVALVLA